MLKHALFMEYDMSFVPRRVFLKSGAKAKGPGPTRIGQRIHRKMDNNKSEAATNTNTHRNLSETHTHAYFEPEMQYFINWVLWDRWLRMSAGPIYMYILNACICHVCVWHHPTCMHTCKLMHMLCVHVG